MHLVSRPSGCGVSYAHARLECFFASRRKVVGTCRRRCHPNLPPPSKLLWSLFPLAVGEKQSFRMACLQGNCLRHIELSNYGSSCFPYYEKSLQTNHHDAPGVFFVMTFYMGHRIPLLGVMLGGLLAASIHWALTESRT